METLQRTANRGSISTGGYEIDNSLKFESDNSEYLYITRDASGSDWNRLKWTASMWVKHIPTESSTTSPKERMFGASDTQSDFDIRFRGQPIGFRNNSDVDGVAELRTTAVYRDYSAWYHVVAVWDTANATAGNRMRLYVNGEEVTDFSTDTQPSQNEKSIWGKKNDGTDGNVVHTIGAQFNAVTGFGQGFNGYMAEIHWVEGEALAPTEFGETDSDTAIWIPKEYTGSYGTNGFYLDFSNSGSLGADASGNGNNWTLNNITAVDQATDTPTNNGCTLNVLASLEGSNDITEGALVSTGASGSFNGTYGTMGIDPFNSTVDWYWEIEASSTTNGSSDDIGIGWIKESRITSGSTAFNNVYADGISRYSSQTTTSAGDIWGVLLETGTTPVFKLYRNDSLIHTSTHGSGGVSFDTLMFPYITVKGTGTDARLNFLNPASSFSIASGNADPNGYGNFEFDPKGGYALCTKNLAEYG